MFEGHNPYLVALSVAIAIIGGYTGFGLAARVRGTPGVARRVLLAGAAAFLAVSIWTMHFTGMMAAPIPPDAAYLVLPTILSFLICVLVVGVSLFFVSIGQPTDRRVMAAAVLLGAGIVSMHYVGVEALTGNFHMEHDPVFIALAVLIAIGAAYGGLRIFLARHGGARLAFSAIAFGIAVSGMHYTAMAGMRFAPGREYCLFASDGLVASPQILSLVVMLLCFAIGGGFLLLLVPEPRSQVSVQLAGSGPAGVFPGWNETLAEATTDDSGSISAHAQRPLPLGGLGQPPPQLAARLPVEGADGVHFIEAAHIRSIRADAHYTKVHDGSRERMSLWSISEAEENLDPAFFMRVHRSHIIAISHVAFVRKEGEGAVVELDGPVPHLVPVSRAKTAELRARLGLTRRNVDQT